MTEDDVWQLLEKEEIKDLDGVKKWAVRWVNEWNQLLPDGDGWGSRAISHVLSQYLERKEGLDLNTVYLDTGEEVSTSARKWLFARYGHIYAVTKYGGEIYDHIWGNYFEKRISTNKT